MKSVWRVTANPIGDQLKYAVYRVLDILQPDHSGNRELATDYMDSNEDAKVISDALNAMEIDAEGARAIADAICQFREKLRNGLPFNRQ